MSSRQLSFVDDYTRREMLRIRRKLDTFTGPGVINTPTSLTLAPTQPGGKTGRPSPPPPSLPVGQYQYMPYLMVTQLVAGFDWVRTHPMVPG